jgi:molybdenum cofactor cytidylyltransferase
MPIAHRLARAVVRQVRSRDQRFLDPQVPVRVVVAPDLATGPFWSWDFGGSLRPGARELPGVCGVLLAAGRGTRFGVQAGAASKLLARWRGRPLASHTVRAWEAAGFATLVCVTGHARAAVEAALRSRSRGTEGFGRPRHLIVVHNRAHARGLGTSVRAAAKRAPAGMGLLFGHADMPALRPVTLRRVATRGSTLRDWIVVPTVAGQPMNPVYFPASLRPMLARVADAEGGKPVIATHRERVFHLPVDDVAGEFRDVDRRADLRRLR